MQVLGGQRSKAALLNHILTTFQFQQGVSLNLEFPTPGARGPCLSSDTTIATFGLNYPKSAGECGGPTSDDHVVYEIMFFT